MKDIFLRFLSETAIKEMTRMVMENEPNSLPLSKLYSLFRIYFSPERNKYHSRADFFELQRTQKDTAAHIWTKVLKTEKNCELENVTAAELILSKFMSQIGRNTGGYELKNKIKKSDMEEKTVTELIHEYMYMKE